MRFFIYAFFLLATVSGYSQNANLVLSGSSIRLVSSGSPTRIVLHNANMTNNASFSSFIPGNGTVLATGLASPSVIGGTDSTLFYNLRTDKSVSELQLASTIHVSNEVELISGNINLSNYTLNLAATGNLLGETYPGGRRAYCNDNQSGRIRAVRTVGAGTNLNIAGLGLDLTLTGGSAGSTIIMRGHDRQTSTTMTGGTGIGRYYDVYPSNNSGFTYDFLFRYHDNELYTMPEQFFVFYRSPSHGLLGNDWEEWGKDDDIFSPGYPDLNGPATHNSTTNEVFLSGINTFSRWTLSNYDVAPLPIVLASLEAICESPYVNVRWVTSSEINNNYFTIERSSDLINWEVLGTVSGAGNSNQQLTYSFIDDRPLNGLGYYRLTQTDYNGDFETFEPVYVVCHISGDNTMTVYPNPAEDYFTVSVSMSYAVSQAVLKISDMNGKEIRSRQITLEEGINEFTFDRFTMNPGAYIIRLEADEITLNPLKLIIK